ncbi:Hypothetical Protein FCC1311_005182 [Hondaea fermentalgiana]|uniref:Uncharacterized protein n=1 Tax=Hondaea fermentalgiana TaxID=2315210 RepID=A0A2R5FZX9_9STRA|nr:Hypothetical Protein FCC1311_005182 [Hondaea fermentalgiana]|eukprot:GBG24300.1 Hypothetical Protein FCC1311_005182 [Hondaea fermentalgiana]
MGDGEQKEDAPVPRLKGLGKPEDDAEAQDRQDARTRARLAAAVSPQERHVFKLGDEEESAREDLVVGDAQKLEVKAVTETWLKYFAEKQINGVLYSAVRSLLHLLELPENPFTFLSNQLRISELFYSVTHTKHADFAFSTLDEKDPDTHVTHVMGNDHVWGLENLLWAIDADAVAELFQRIELACPAVLRPGTSEQGAYYLRHVNALTGPAIFHGNILPYLPTKIEIREDCMVSGPKFEKAVGIFANQIINEVFAVADQDPRLAIGVLIEKTQHLKGNGTGSHMGGGVGNNRLPSHGTKRMAGAKDNDDDYRLWTVDKIRASRNSFQSAIKAATVSSREIIFRFVLELPHLHHESAPTDASETEDLNRKVPEEETDEYDRGLESLTGRESSHDEDTIIVRGEGGQFVAFHKSFSLHFQLTDKDDGTPTASLRSFALFPFSSLCDGVFRSKRDAVFYAELFKTADGKCWTLDNKQDLHASFRASLKADLVKGYIAGDLIGAVEILITLTCMARRYAVIPDIIRLLHSQVGHLYGLTKWNEALRIVLERCRVNQDSNRFQDHAHGDADRRGRLGGFTDLHLVDKVVQQFRVYKKQLLMLVDASESSEMAVMCLPVQHKLYNMSDHITQRLVVDEKTTPAALENVNNMCEALVTTVSRDMVAVLTSSALHEDPSQNHDGGTPPRRESIVALIDEVIQQALLAPPKDLQTSGKMNPKDARRKRRSSIVDEGPVLGAEDSSSFDVFSSAGVETMEAYSNEMRATARARENVRVVSVPNAIKLAKKKRNVPTSIAREAVLLEYVTETRIDAVLRDIVLDVLNNGKLYPNPYPLVVARLRAEVARHALWREPDPDLLKLVSSSPSRISLCNLRCHLYKMTEANLFGTIGALRACEPALVERTLSTLEASGVISPAQGPNCALGDHPGAAPSSSARTRTAYEVSVSTSIGGAFVLHSCMSRLAQLQQQQSRQRHQKNHNPDQNADAKDGTGPTGQEGISISWSHELRNHPSLTLFETHVYDGPHATEAVDVHASHLIAHGLHLNDKSASNVLLCMATGQHAMKMINEDGAFDGGWKPMQMNERHRVLPHGPWSDEQESTTTSGDVDSASVSAESTLPPKRKLTELHEAGFFTRMQDKLYHPKYTHGAVFKAQQLRRDKALCKQELVRAIEAHEPVVVRVAVLFDTFYVVVTKVASLYFVQSPHGIVHSFAPAFYRYEALYQSVWGNMNQAMSAFQAICGGQQEMADPRDPGNPICEHYTLSLKLRVAQAYSEGKLATVYRGMLRLALLEGDKETVPDLLRMFKKESLARELSDLGSRSEVVRALLEERYRSEESRGKIKTRLLQALFGAFKFKVEGTLARADCVFFPGVHNAVHALLLKTDSAIGMDRIG